MARRGDFVSGLNCSHKRRKREAAARWSGGTSQNPLSEESGTERMDAFMSVARGALRRAAPKHLTLRTAQDIAQIVLCHHKADD